MLSTSRRQSLLDEPLLRARGQLRARDRRDAQPDAEPRSSSRTISAGIRALTGLGLPADAGDQDPQVAIGRLAADRQIRVVDRSPASPAARENASQVREEISSEMWEQLNRLFHEVAQSEVDPQDAAAVMRLVVAGPRRLVHLLRRDRDDDEPRRGLAVRAARQVHRARLRGLDAARRLLLDADQGRRSGLGDAARQLRGVRVVLPGLHRRSAAGSDREVPARPPGVPVLGALRRRAHARVARGDRRELDRPASACGSSGSSAGCARRSRSRRCRSSWPAICTRS